MIKEKDLLEHGFEKADFWVTPYQKVLSEPDEDGGVISIIVTLERNSPEFALQFPDGSKLFLIIENIRELETFEKMIQGWEPNY